jgi:hypothetical protein
MSRTARVRAAKVPAASAVACPVQRKPELMPMAGALEQVVWIGAQERVTLAEIGAAVKAFHHSARGAVPASVVTLLIRAMKPMIGANFVRLRAHHVEAHEAAETVMDRVNEVLGLMPRRLVDARAFTTYASITINASLSRLTMDRRHQRRLQAQMSDASDERLRHQWPDEQAVSEIQATVHEDLVTFLAEAIPRALPDVRHQAIMRRVFRLAPYEHAPPVDTDAVLCKEFGVKPRTIGLVRQRLRDYIRLTCDSAPI